MLELLVLLQLTQILILSLILLVTLNPRSLAAKQRDFQLMKQRLRAATLSAPDPKKQKHLARCWNDAVKAVIDADPNRSYWDPPRSIL